MATTQLNCAPRDGALSQHNTHIIQGAPDLRYRPIQPSFMKGGDFMMRNKYAYLYIGCMTVIGIVSFLIGCGGGGSSSGGSSGCKSDQVACGKVCCSSGTLCCPDNNTCCRSGYPYYCASVGLCFETTAGAVKACGNSYVTCGYSPGGGGCKDSCNRNDCSYYLSQFRCGAIISPGVQYTGGLVPDCPSCDCPSGTYFAGYDRITNCGPWKICACK